MLLYHTCRVWKSSRKLSLREMDLILQSIKFRCCLSRHFRRVTWLHHSLAASVTVRLNTDYFSNLSDQDRSVHVRFIFLFSQDQITLTLLRYRHSSTPFPVFFSIQFHHISCFSFRVPGWSSPSAASPAARSSATSGRRTWDCSRRSTRRGECQTDPTGSH